MFKFHFQNGKKLKSGETFSELQNWVIRGLQIGACFRDYKLGQEGLKIRAAFFRDFKSGQKYYISGQEF